MYSFESRVRYSECDRHCKLALLPLINYLQDCSIFHSEAVGLGIDYMHEHGRSWLLASWHIEIMQLPRLGDSITTSTWCHSMSRRLASRNFTICDASGTQLVRADSLWFLYDFNLGRPIVVTDDQDAYFSDDKPLDMSPALRKLPVEGPYIEAPAITIEEHHLDANRHVNNAQYLAMAIDALDGAYQETGLFDDIAHIRIVYRQQALLGDVIVPHVQQNDAAYTVDLVGPDGNSHAVVRIEPRA